MATMITIGRATRDRLYGAVMYGSTELDDFSGYVGRWQDRLLGVFKDEPAKVEALNGVLAQIPPGAVA
jgi:hypothetical protein